MSGLTQEQQQVVDAPMMPLCVIACAGSGKTKTAVHRLVRIRRSLGEARGRVALLSYSNVAVNTFREAYQDLATNLPSNAGRSRVHIDTLDGFITTNIVRPHSHRTMRSSRAPFLVSGGETFLQGFTFATSSFPRPITALQLALVEGEEAFFHSFNDQTELVNTSIARSLITRLGRTGAYTHELGRYWAYRTLSEQPEILAALVRRYPQIVIDEAQDIGSVHQCILELLISAGCCVTLIGDPNQGIYEFAGATGEFLIAYQQRGDVQRYSLEQNFRSAPSVVALANVLCGRSDVAARSAPGSLHGAFFTGYKRDEHTQLITAFRGAMSAASANVTRSAVLCRGQALANKLRGEKEPAGQGVVKAFAAAAVLRDQQNDFLKAFHRVAIAVVALLEDAPHGLLSLITQPSGDAQGRALRKTLWTFTRDAHTGLPSSLLIANSEWHSSLLARTRALLADLECRFGLKPTMNIGRKLSTKELPNVPLASPEDLSSRNAARLRIDTVHKAKGESLDAVLYVTLKEHARALLDGATTEVGRIGYVAATRARDLLWVAVPHNALRELRPMFTAKGFVEITAADTRSALVDI